MKDQINTIREALLDARSLLHDGRRQDKALTALSDLESSLAQYEAGDVASAAAQGFRDGVASVAQQPQARPDFTDEWAGYLKDGETPFERFLRERKDVQSALKLYQRALEENERLKGKQPQAERKERLEAALSTVFGWKQPQAEAVPVVDRVYEAAKRLVDHADFQLGGVLSAKSKARDIPSNAASKVKARHLASLRDALAKAPQQAEAVLSEGQIEVACEAVAGALGDAYDCTRVWSAWSYGTMGPEDFIQVSEDSDRVREITLAALGAAGLKVTP